MKLDTNTVDILKNFANINPSLAFKKGNVLKTISLSSGVIAKAKLKQEIESDFAIYDLGNFISALSLFEEPFMDLSDDRFVMLTNEDKSASIQYFYADPANIITPPEREFEAPKTNLKFRMTKDVLADITKAASVLALPEIVFVADGKNVTLQTTNSKNITSNMYNRTIAATEAVYQIFIKIENLRLIPVDYDVTITPPKSKTGSGVVYFGSPDVEYWIAAEHHSKF